MKSILKISLDDIQYNWKLLNTASNGKAAAVLKANAYGMGMIEVVGALLECGCNYFYVANIFEGLKLRKKFKNTIKHIIGSASIIAKIFCADAIWKKYLQI